MSNKLREKVRAAARGGASRFLLNQVAHTTLTVAVLAALVFGAARVGALSRVLAPLAQESGSSFTTVNYQGRLADAAGAPVDNPNPGVGMTFALYDAETDGTPLWTETHANVPVSGGLFSVRLGSVAALSTDLLAGDRWLGIQIGSDAEMTPREKLSAVPYAMVAGQAMTVMDGSITDDSLARHYEVGTVNTDENWIDVTFATPFNSIPAVLATVMTESGLDVAHADVRNVSQTGFQIKVEDIEDVLSGGDESHNEETIAWIAIEL